MSIESCLSRVHGELCACEEKVQSIIRTMVSCYTQRASAWRRKRQGGVNSNRETMKPGSWHKWLQHLKSGSWLHIFFSFSISLFTNDLCFNIWHSKTSAMPSCGGISLLCWELKFHFWNFSLLDLWRTLSSDIALCLCHSVRREENYQAKACSFSFAKSRVRWQSDWGNAWMWSKRARNMKWDHDVYCRLQVPDKSRQDQLQELRNEVHHPSPNWDILPLRDYGNNRSSKVWVPGGFWILEGGDSGNHIVQFYTAVLDVIKMGL